MIFTNLNYGTEIFNDTGFNLYNVEFLTNDNLFIGFLDKLNDQDKTQLFFYNLKPINNLKIKLNNQIGESVITQLNNSIENNGKITFETTPGITHTGSAISNIKATYNQGQI